MEMLIAGKMKEIKLYMQNGNFEIMYACGNTNRKY